MKNFNLKEQMKIVHRYIKSNLVICQEAIKKEK